MPINQTPSASGNDSYNAVQQKTLLTIPPRLAKTFAQAVGASALLLSLTACGSLDRDNNLRVWENSRVETVHKLAKHHYRSARSSALDAVDTAQTFGRNDFRLGVSLSDLADVYKAQEEYKKAEENYEKAIKVLDEASKQGQSIDKRLALEDKATAMAHLADMYAIQDKYELAAKKFRQAAILFETILGQGIHGEISDCFVGQQLVQCLCGLAQVSTRQNDSESAAKAYDQALQYATVSNCPEFVLGEIRDSYIKVLTKLGRKEQTRSLLADTVWSAYTNKGLKAYYGNDYHAAEIFLTKALEEAKISQFGDRRVIRSAANLAACYTKLNRPDDTLRVCEEATRNRNLQRYDRDFDNLLASLANTYQIKGTPQLALPVLRRQYKYRVKEHGRNSIGAAETLAAMAKTYVLVGDLRNASRTAHSALAVLDPEHIHDKRAALALSDSAVSLDRAGEFAPAEKAYKQLLELQCARLSAGDVRLTGHAVQVINFYQKYQQREGANKVCKQMLERLEHSTEEQRASAFPYIELATSIMMADKNDWFNEALPLAKFGQSLLRKELAGAQIESGSLQRWKEDIAKLEKHFGYKI
jgi:tetratricopeptide (TPR) repeat protein